jgi:hypothetical protein
MNYALPGNPNETLTKKQAIEHVVDACINDEECEWAACSVTMVIKGHKTKADAIKDITEVAKLSFTIMTDEMIEKAYQDIYKNQAMFA